MGAAPSMEKDKEAKEKLDKSHAFLSADLRTLMHDYFNRYDLDGSQTINSSEELKQLCTNLVVKLDLPMDVAQIDKIVSDAGAFEDDEVPAGQDKPAKGSRNEWNLEEFVMWFVKKDRFNVDKDWLSGDQSDEDEEPTADKPFLTGTYQGELEGGGKKYTIKNQVGGSIKNGELVGYTVENSNLFTFKIRAGDDGVLMPRPGCDSVGLYTSSGKIEGTKITMVIEYDLDGDASTVEPKLVLEGEWGGPDNKMDISGTWKNETAEQSADQMGMIGLEGVQEGTFKLSKRIRDDE